MREMYELAALGRGARRVRRRVAEGEGMATPQRRLEVKVDGRVEILVPGRSRVHPDHPWVKARPDLFRAAWTKDEATRLALEIAGHLATRRAAGAPDRPKTDGRKPLRLPQRRPLRRVLP